MLITLMKDGARNSKIERIGFITKAFVSDEYRGQKLMRKMFDRTVSWLRENSIEHLELSVNSNNILGLRTWEGFGFVEKRKIMGLDLNNK